MVLVLAALHMVAAAYAQPTVTGTVTDENSGNPIPGASVFLAGTTLGGATDATGRYEIVGAPLGTYTLAVFFLGYNEATRIITVREGATVQVDFTLSVTSVALEAMEVFSSRALDRSTPVAFSNLDQARIQRELGMRDVPLVLNSMPSVYSTVQGGGAGDARVNVRGFNQRNVAIMINGIPVNDMESGWLYWSNWDGLGEVTNSIQLQRGLSAVNLATPSIGGSMNIITDPAHHDRQILVKQEYGNDGVGRTTLMASTGLMKEKLAITISGVRKIGSGYVNGTWTDMWSYYAAAGWNVTSRHRVDFFAIGASQRHGQNLFKQNLAAYDHEYARKVFQQDGLTDATISDILKRIPEGGRRWNQNVGELKRVTYTDVQHNGFGEVRRHNKRYFDEIENFFHKPIVSLSHFGQLSERSLLSTVLYYSGGKGGGSGRHGTFEFDDAGPSPVPDYDTMISRNRDRLSQGILRNRHNVQWTVGGISKFSYRVSDQFSLEAGVDWRTAEIQHYSTIRDLLGGNGYWRRDSDFWGEDGRVLVLGDRFDYNDIVAVSWVGGFVQGQMEMDRLAGFAVAGYSAVGYTFEDFYTEQNGQPFRVHPDPLTGYQLKGGVTANLTGTLSAFISAGIVSKVPVFDGVIDAISRTVNANPQNETFVGLEAGATYRSLNRRLTAKLNVYRTRWDDRTVTRSLVEQSGNAELVSIRGLDSQHIGVEGEVAFQPRAFLRLDAAFSVGDWRYTANVFGKYTPDRSDPGTQTDITLYLKDIMVGDAPQTQLAYAVTVLPLRTVRLTVSGRSYARHFADFDPAGQVLPGTRVWETPPYTVVDAQAQVDFMLRRVPARIFVHVFNLFDATYVQDATNNSRFHAYPGNGVGQGTADDAAVFLGLPRTWSVGTRIVL